MRNRDEGSTEGSSMENESSRRPSDEEVGSSSGRSRSNESIEREGSQSERSSRDDRSTGNVGRSSEGEH